MSNKYGWIICPPDALDYIHWQDESARRGRAGERQTKCRLCGKYYWPGWEADAAEHQRHVPARKEAR